MTHDLTALLTLARPLVTSEATIEAGTTILLATYDEASFYICCVEPGEYGIASLEDILAALEPVEPGGANRVVEQPEVIHTVKQAYELGALSPEGAAEYERWRSAPAPEPVQPPAHLVRGIAQVARRAAAYAGFRSLGAEVAEGLRAAGCVTVAREFEAALGKRGQRPNFAALERLSRGLFSQH